MIMDMIFLWLSKPIYHLQYPNIARKECSDKNQS